MSHLAAPSSEHPGAQCLSPVQLLLVVLRAAMEMGIVVGLAYWGFALDGGAAIHLIAGLGAPAVGFGFWGAVDFRGAGRLAEPLRLVQELLVSGLAAAAVIAAGHPALGWALAALSIVYHALVYVSGTTLLADRSAPADATAARGRGLRVHRRPSTAAAGTRRSGSSSASSRQQDRERD